MQVPTPTTDRKYFLDWLRVIAFALLILFHVGLLYSTWHYNLKSPRIYPGIEFALNALSPWRLALLFFISGVACRFLIEKLRPGTFARDRLRRLGTVILFGMLVVIPPQTYVELYHRGFVTTGYLEFWLTSYLLGDPYPGKTLPTWDHLWFLVYLLPYTLALAAAVRLVPSAFSRAAGTSRIGLMFIVPGICLCVANILVSEFQPVTHELVNDWAAHIRWLCMFGAGVACARRSEFWETARDNRLAIAALAGFFLILQLGCSLYARTSGADASWIGIANAILRGLYGWSAILAISGFAMRHLDQPSAALTYLNTAILPVYVLHQPLLLIAAYFLFPVQLPPAIEAIALITLTGGGALLIYELGIRRFDVVRVLFGLRRRENVALARGQ